MKGCLGREQERVRRGTQEDYASSSCSLRYYGDGISFQVVFWPIILTQCPSWWLPFVFKMDASEEGFWGGKTGGIFFGRFPELFPVG